jgi:hypothetical protein
MTHKQGLRNKQANPANFTPLHLFSKLIHRTLLSKINPMDDEIELAEATAAVSETQPTETLWEKLYAE